jgi:hypothetical protein
MPSGIVQVTEGSGKKLDTWQRTKGANTVEEQSIVIGEHPLAQYTVSTLTAVSLATANDHLVQIMAGSSNRLRIRRIEVSQMALATTAGINQFALYRLTTAGTGGTSITPQLVDPADSAAGATAMTLPSAKGTEGALLWTGSVVCTQTVSATPAMNERLLVLDFDGNRLKPIHVASGTSNGIALKNITARAAATALITVWFDETSWI